MAEAKAKKAPAKSSAKAKVASGKLGIADLAKATGLQPASVRIKLRNAKVKRAGKGYAFSQAEVAKLTKQFTA